MRRMLIVLVLLVLAGCTQALDKELLSMREQAAANEKLYGVASQKFADAFDQLADQKHEFQEYLIVVEGDAWVRDHTKDGNVTATPAEFSAMLAKRDGRLTTLESSRRTARQIVSDFRQMVQDKTAFSGVIYAKEVNAQEAKSTYAAAVDSLVKGLAGFAASAATFVPLAF